MLAGAFYVVITNQMVYNYSDNFEYSEAEGTNENIRYGKKTV